MVGKRWYLPKPQGSFRLFGGLGLSSFIELSADDDYEAQYRTLLGEEPADRSNEQLLNISPVIGAKVIVFQNWVAEVSLPFHIDVLGDVGW